MKHSCPSCRNNNIQLMLDCPKGIRCLKCYYAWPGKIEPQKEKTRAINVEKYVRDGLQSIATLRGKLDAMEIKVRRLAQLIGTAEAKEIASLPYNEADFDGKIQ